MASIDYLGNKQTFRSYLDRLQNAYERGDPLVSDEQFDELVELYEEKFSAYDKVGAAVDNSVLLPYYLGSLNKIKGLESEKKLHSFISKVPAPYLISDKLDGVSALYYKSKLFTRGDGVKGKDISPLLQYLNLPKTECAVRGELVISEDDFYLVAEDMRQSNPSSKNKFTDPRSMVSGIVNSIKADNLDVFAAKHLRFITYAIMNEEHLTPRDQLVKLKSQGFRIVMHKLVDSVSIKSLSSTLRRRRQMQGGKNPFIDGIVITSNTHWSFPIGKNPSHMIAYKEDVRLTTTVTHVEWVVKKDRQLFPIVHFQPIQLMRATLTQATGKNAAFIIENGIGRGAQILVARANDVIPDIAQVLKSVEPDLPPYDEGEYEWDVNHVRFLMKNISDNKEYAVANMEHFVKSMKIDRLGVGRLESFYDIGIHTVKELIEADVDLMCTAHRIGQVTAQAINDNINNAILFSSNAIILNASNIFKDIGSSRSELIIEEMPNFLTLSLDSVASRLEEMKGFGDVLISTILTKRDDFKSWLQDIPILYERWQSNLEHKLVVRDRPILQVKSVDGLDLNGAVVLLTGVTDRGDVFKHVLESYNAKLAKSFTKAVTLLVAKDVNRMSGKMKAAKERGVTIITLDEFKQMLGL